jgi:serum/glucocorticoid-regulated kinase 2
MDFINGGELFYHLKKDGRFEEERVRFYAAECLLALEHLHTQGIIYRDLKPENVLIDAEGHIKITDFGLSKVGLPINEQTSSFCGTPEYLAPEVIKGGGYSFGVDIWSLGLVVYEMLCGHHPFKLKNKNKYEKWQMIGDLNDPVQVPHHLSSKARNLLTGLLEKNVSS